MIQAVDPRATGMPLRDASELTIGKRYFVVHRDCCGPEYTPPPFEETLTSLGADRYDNTAVFGGTKFFNLDFFGTEWWAYPIKQGAPDPG